MKIAAPHSDFQDVRLRVEEPGEESQHSAPRPKLTKLTTAQVYSLQVRNAASTPSALVTNGEPPLCYNFGCHGAPVAMAIILLGVRWPALLTAARMPSSQCVHVTQAVDKILIIVVFRV